MQYIKVNGEWRAINTKYKKENGSWILLPESGFPETEPYVFGSDVSFTLSVVGAETASGTSSNYCVLRDGIEDVTTGVTWAIVSGSEYATIDQSGKVTIIPGASDASVTISATYMGVPATKNLALTYSTGTTTHTETDVVVDESGNTITTITTVVENTDGSFEGNSTSYNEDGQPISSVNSSGDASGNVNTQGIDYDESGNTAVTSYSIDTTDNPDGYKNYNADGVNTEYYAFDVTQGFVLDFHFTIDFSGQPAGQNENHHNILTAKRTNPSPWYGFHLRHTSTNKSIILGTQFSSGSNTNKTITPMSSTGNTAEYNLKIIYDPTASTNKFSCINANTGTDLYSNNGTFPDIPELKYIKVTIGYAMDPNGDPYRFSNINVMNFNLRKLGRVDSANSSDTFTF